MIIQSREKDLGGFLVRRVLPYATRRMVGPFIFFDHMGPAEFNPGKGMDVRPHPHINLATVTYLFSGTIHHRDSLGSDQLIEPGAINWMTAGRGIVHSERTPITVRETGSSLHGIQLWVALPESHEECDPSFVHHPKSTLPEFSLGRARIKLLLGNAFGKSSPVKVHSDLFYAEVFLPAGEEITLPVSGGEGAFYLLSGNVDLAGTNVSPLSMAVGQAGDDLKIRASQDAHLMFLGGQPLGERAIFWNFVSSSKSRLEEAKKDWEEGPRKTSARFHPILGDDEEFIPLPKT